MRTGPLTRADYIPNDGQMISTPDSTAVAYLHVSNGRPAVVAFSGKRQSPTLNHSYANETSRAADLKRFFDDVRTSEERGRTRKAAKHA